MKHMKTAVRYGQPKSSLNRKYIPLPTHETDSDNDDFLSNVQSKNTRQEAILIDTDKPGSTHPFPKIVRTRKKQTRSNPVCCAWCVVLGLGVIILLAIAAVFLLAISGECSFCGILVKEDQTLNKGHESGSKPISTGSGRTNTYDAKADGLSEVGTTADSSLADSVTGTISLAEDDTAIESKSTKSYDTLTKPTTTSSQRNEDVRQYEGLNPANGILSKILIGRTGGDVSSTFSPQPLSNVAEDANSKDLGLTQVAIDGQRANPSPSPQAGRGLMEELEITNIKADIAKYLEGLKTTKSPGKDDVLGVSQAFEANRNYQVTKSYSDSEEKIPTSFTGQTTDQEQTQGREFVDSHTVGERTKDWTVEIPDAATESSIRLIDVDGDGLDDIIFGATYATHPHQVMESGADTKEFCATLGVEPPCLGVIMAYRGYDGKELWKTFTASVPFVFNCGNVDINQDGTMDCFGAGVSGFVAFNPKNGSIFYTDAILGGAMNKKWNTYQPLVINRDFDNDGVSEVVLAHGGNHDLPASVIDRDPGRLILISGATGRIIGRYLDIPNSKETYMSPVLHQTGDGTQYVLFGSGGETISGAFLAISVEDLYNFATGRLLERKTWGRLSPDEHGIIEIFHTKSDSERGVMVPPTLVEMTGDSVNDIMMIAFDGTAILYNGDTLEEIWHIYMEGYESYSSPSPAHFNDDDTLDFMMHWSPGMWPKYPYSTTAVINGKDGSILWQKTTDHYLMTSDLVLRTTQPNRDVFLFIVQGREGKFYGNPSGEVKELNPIQIVENSVRKRRDLLHTANLPGDLEQGDDHEKTEAHGNKEGDKFGKNYGSSVPNLPSSNDNGNEKQYKDQKEVSLNEENKLSTIIESLKKLGTLENGEDERLKAEIANSIRKLLAPKSTQDISQYPDENKDSNDGVKSGLGTISDQVQAFGPEMASVLQKINFDLGKFKQDSDSTGDDNQPGIPRDGPPSDHMTEEEKNERKATVADTCNKDERSFRAEVLAMDRTAMSYPKQLVQMDMYKWTYTLTETERQFLWNQSDISDYMGKVKGPETFNYGPFCSLVIPEETPTGAIADLDGDGNMDMVLLFLYRGFKHDELGRFVHVKYNIKLMKINLEYDFPIYRNIHMDATVSNQMDATVSNQMDPTALSLQGDSVPMSLVKFLPYAKQPWTSYLGTKGNGVYNP